MARQLRTPSAPTSSRVSYAPTFVERRLNGETIKLLRAPTIEDSTMWKQQCFESVYNTLRNPIHQLIPVEKGKMIQTIILLHRAIIIRNPGLNKLCLMHTAHKPNPI